MSQRPLWKNYLSAAIKTGGKLVPGVAQAIDVIETVENRREDESRHAHTLAELSRVEKSVVEVIEREMKAVLTKLHMPNITPRELEEEISNLYAMRGYGREPFLAQGLLTNSQWYDQLRTKPNLYGRVLQDHDKPSPECFYMFIDTEKTRMLEVSPFALQQLLGGQLQGAPASKVIGQHDLFAERLPTPTIIKPAPVVADISPARIMVPGGTTPQWKPPAELADLHQKAMKGDKNAMCPLAWGLYSGNKDARHPDDEQAVRWYRKAADAGDANGMYNHGVMYANGRGVAKDEAQAVHWYRKAADAGHANGMFNLGIMYANGQGVVKDEAEAVRWYRKAADAGDASGMGSLGWAYVQGQGGLAKDRAKGVKLLRMGFASGNAWSCDRLKKLGEVP